MSRSSIRTGHTPIATVLNLSLQRQLPKGIIADATYFYNHTGQINNVNYNLNQMDPRIAIQYGAATNATVSNPFYHLAIPNPSPGALWNQATVGVTSLAGRIRNTVVLP